MKRERRPQRRARLLHDAHVKLETIVAEGREAVAGYNNGITEAFADFVERVAAVSLSIAGPAPRETNKAAHGARATPPANAPAGNGMSSAAGGGSPPQRST